MKWSTILMQDIKNVQVCWNKNDYVNLDYYDPGAKAEDFPGYNVPTFANNLTNEVYHMPNPMPGFVDKVLDLFDYDIKSPAFNLMKPGQVLPFHKDQYGQYIKKYNLTDITKIQRYIIFLEDAKLGHMFAFEEKVFYNWKAGDVVSWTGQKKHAAYNMGTENRYTLQITCTNK